MALTRRIAVLRLVAAVAVAAAGCQTAKPPSPGFLDATTTSLPVPSDTGTTLAPSSAAGDKAAASQIILQPADLPKGWFAEATGPGGGFTGAFIVCLSSSVTFPSAGQAADRSFVGPNAAQLTSAATLFPFPSQVDLDLRDLQDSHAIPCLNQVWGDALKAQALGVPAATRPTFGTTSFATLPFPDYAQGVLAFRGVTPYTAKAGNGAVTLDLVFIRRRRTVASFVFYGPRSPVAADLEQQDAKIVADRMTASAVG